MRRLVRATILAAVLTFWPERMWGAEEPQPTVAAMLINMEWCLPSDATILDYRPPYENVLVGNQASPFAFEVLKVGNDTPGWKYGPSTSHPDRSDLHIQFALPGNSMSDDERSQYQIFQLLAAGCFAMSAAPS